MTPEYLVAELDAEAPKFFSIALAVGFENRTEFVYGNEPDRLEKLGRLMKESGVPLGYIGMANGPHQLTIYTKTLDYGDDDPFTAVAEDALHRIARNIAERLEGEVGYKPRGWPN